MNLFILRHGIAGVPGEDGLPKNLPDTERPLSAKGRQRLAGVAEAMRKLELHFDVVLSSPLLRARQTAQDVIELLDLRRKLTLTDHLAPDGSEASLIDLVNGLGPRGKDVLLVGHEPHLSKLISLLVTGSTMALFDLRKGGLVKLEIEQLRCGRCATLSWMLTPKQMLLMK